MSQYQRNYFVCFVFFFLIYNLESNSDGDDILFPDSEAKSNREQRRTQRQYNPQYGNDGGKMMMNSQIGGQINQQYNPQQNVQQQNTQNYIATNNIPMGAAHYKGRIFLTVPRRRVGVPSTLNFVYTKSTKGSSPSYKAFPNTEMNDLHVINFNFFPF